jgi:predicted secreted hydrolase
LVRLFWQVCTLLGASCSVILRIQSGLINFDMKNMRLITIFGISILLVIVVGVLFTIGDDEQVSTSLVAPKVDASGFKRATEPIDFVFPADHGPHPDFQTEWWYYTGNLETQDGRHFGYQLTFFRRSLSSYEEQVERSSTWATNWEIVQTGENQYRLTAEEDAIHLDLILEDVKELISHGERGLSQRGPEPGNASYYYSKTRLQTSGEIQVGEAVYQVQGLSWKDHDYSTLALLAGQIGWDWFSIQLQDGSDLMVFQIRRADGSIDPYSSGTLVTPEGDTLHLSSSDFEIEVRDTWRSPHSGGSYPVRWIVRLPQQDLILEIDPYLLDQEMNLSYTYWEGAVKVSGSYEGNPVEGDGYVEMTGYAGSFEGEF